MESSINIGHVDFEEGTPVRVSLTVILIDNAILRVHKRPRKQHLHVYAYCLADKKIGWIRDRIGKGLKLSGLSNLLQQPESCDPI